MRRLILISVLGLLLVGFSTSEENKWIVIFTPWVQTNRIAELEQENNGLKEIAESLETDIQNLVQAKTTADGRIAELVEELRYTRMLMLQARGTKKPVSTPEPYEPLKVAFIADTDIYSGTPQVFELIKDEGVDMVLHQGDAWNANDWDTTMPYAFENEVTAFFGEDFPFYTTVGNHDIFYWDTYKPMQVERLGRTETTCIGEIGTKAACTLGGITFLMIDAWQGEGNEAFITEQLAASESPWKICLWHYNATTTQVAWEEGYTWWEEAVDISLYDACRKGGAFIVNGHAESYARSNGISDFSNMTVAPEINLGDGNSFVAISGIAGWHSYSNVRCRSDCPEWASIYTKRQDAKWGALFVTFYETEAIAYFKNIDGEIIDNFTIKLK